VANVIGHPSNANSPNTTTSHTGMNALRLKSIDMVVTLLSFLLGTDEEPEWPWPLRVEPRVSASGAWPLEYATPGGKKEAGFLDPPHGSDYAATRTLICLGLASSRSGSRTVSTPALYSALTLPASTVGGSANVRANEP
jgi:hypothetical protein